MKNEFQLRARMIWVNKKELADGRKSLIVLSDGKNRFDAVGWDEISERLREVPLDSELDVVGYLTSFTKKMEKYSRTQLVITDFQVLSEEKEFSFD